MLYQIYETQRSLDGGHLLTLRKPRPNCSATPSPFNQIPMAQRMSTGVRPAVPAGQRTTAKSPPLTSPVRSGRRKAGHP